MPVYCPPKDHTAWPVPPDGTLRTPEQPIPPHVGPWTDGIGNVAMVRIRSDLTIAAAVGQDQSGLWSMVVAGERRMMEFDHFGIHAAKTWCDTRLASPPAHAEYYRVTIGGVDIPPVAPAPTPPPSAPPADPIAAILRAHFGERYRVEVKATTVQTHRMAPSDTRGKVGYTVTWTDADGHHTHSGDLDLFAKAAP